MQEKQMFIIFVVFVFAFWAYDNLLCKKKESFAEKVAINMFNSRRNEFNSDKEKEMAVKQIFDDANRIIADLHNERKLKIRSVNQEYNKTLMRTDVRFNPGLRDKIQKEHMKRIQSIESISDQQIKTFERLIRKQVDKIMMAPVKINNVIEQAVVAGCEYEPVQMRCSNNKGISNARIKYGRWNNKVCPHGSVNENTEPRQKLYMLKSAEGKNSFEFSNINSHPDVNEDIYPGVVKHWEVEYNCI